MTNRCFEQSRWFVDHVSFVMSARCRPLFACLTMLVVALNCSAATAQNTQQLKRLLKRFPDADANKDGQLTIEEANAYRRKMRPNGNRNEAQRGAPREFTVDPGWDDDRFPEHAVCYKSPKEIAAIYRSTLNGRGKAITSYPKPTDKSLRIVGTGHSFMAPGYKTFPLIARAAGLKQPPLLTHTGGGMTGSARYKWEQENGIFQFDSRPTPKLLASIANAEWDAMMWGPYFNDRTAYYSCWIDFALKYNPDMKFYLSDAWPQLYQLGKIPSSEKELTAEVIARTGEEKNAVYGEAVRELDKSYPGRVFVLPTSDAMVIAAEYYHRGQLPGVEGIHKVVGGQVRSLWRDKLGHLGPGFGNLEGYVFYATIYGRSPELIEGEVEFDTPSNFPGQPLDRVFRRIAWEAVLKNPLSGVKDSNNNKIADDRE